MDQDKISEFIKEVRLKDKLSQEKFGKKYGVTYQAVSKWENGKNIPDISILKDICKDYNKDINELLNGNKKSNNKFVIIFITLILIAAITLLSLLIIFKDKDNDQFNFKTITTDCDNFELYGSIAYDKSKTSIYISNIIYCGEENKTKYKKIECTLYEQDGNTKTEVRSYTYDEKEIMLEDFLKQVKFNIDHYSDSCKMYKENGLIVEIKATDKNGNTTLYNIPLVLEDNCK